MGSNVHDTQDEGCDVAPIADWGSQGFGPAENVRLGATYYSTGVGWLRVVGVEEALVLVEDAWHRFYEVPRSEFYGWQTEGSKP